MSFSVFLKLQQAVLHMIHNTAAGFSMLLVQASALREELTAIKQQLKQTQAELEQVGGHVILNVPPSLIRHWH